MGEAQPQRPGLTVPVTDTHAHLDGYGDELPAVLDRAAGAGVWRIIAVGSDAASSARAFALARSQAARRTARAQGGGRGRQAGPGPVPGATEAGGPQVMAAVGLHPHDATHYRRQASQLAELVRRGTASGLVVAVGETGLDYYRDLSPRPEQRAAFLAQIGLALDHGLPLIVHDRDAHQDVLAILRSAAPFPAGGIMHCYSGDLTMAQHCMDLGFLVSFAGPLTFPKSARLRDLAGRLPLDRIVVETDCPYLAPHPFRGKRNEPAYVTYTARALAAARDEGFEEVARTIEDNVDKLLAHPNAVGLGKQPRPCRTAQTRPE